MGLKVWLPLNGDLHNQGISSSNISLVSGNTWVSSGKIGNNSLTLTKLQTILPTSSCMTGAKEISYCYWVKVNTAWSANWLDGIRWIETDGSATSTARQEFYTNCTLVGTWYKGGSISGKSFTPGVWTHFAGTFNYNTGEAKFYINGVVQGTTTNINTTYYCRGDFYIGDNGTDICENDVRIYDHCLSAAEIREISQGLVLHYKLDSFQGSYGNPNLITNFDTSFLSYADGATTLFTNQMNSGTQEIISNFAGANKCLHLHSNGGSNRQYRTIGLAVGKTYTISADYYSTTRQTLAWRGELNGGNYSWSPASAGTYDTPGVWKRMSYTYSDLTSNATLYFFTHCANGTDCYIKNIKIEYGSSATAWSSSDISTTIIQDNSGYNHNGILTNTAFITSNTPRYSNAIYLSKVKINCTDGFPTGENPNFTISFWTKILSTITYVSYGDLIGMYDTGQGSNTFRLELCGSPASNNLMWFRGPSGQSGGGFNMNSSSSSGWFTKDTWHHIVLAGDGINKKYYCYLDGNLCQTYNGSANSWQPTGQWYLGDTTEATAYFSDLRIYCTTLDADTIRQLYEVGAKVDNKQNMHTYEFIETNKNLFSSTLWTSSYGNHEPNQSPFLSYTDQGEPLFNINSTHAGSAYIEINPTNKTYYYDMTLSVNAGNQAYIGFQRYDANKTSRSNNATVYIYQTKPTTDIIKQRFKGTVNLSTDGVNPCKYISLRVLNGWSGTTSGVTGTLIIHRFSLREVENMQYPKITKQHQFIAEELSEWNNAKFYQDGIVESNYFIER